MHAIATCITQEVLYYSLEGLLDEQETLAFNSSLGTLSLLTCEEERPLLLAEARFTAAEVSLLLPLLEAYPYYCPHEKLYASFYNLPMQRAEKELQEALALNTLYSAMGPIRSVLSRIRAKLEIFGIDINSILLVGYLLMPRKDSFHEHSNSKHA